MEKIMGGLIMIISKQNVEGGKMSVNELHDGLTMNLIKYDFYFN